MGRQKIEDKKDIRKVVLLLKTMHRE